MGRASEDRAVACGAWGSLPSLPLCQGFHMNNREYDAAKLPKCTGGFFVEHMSGPERFMKDQVPT